MKYIIIALSIHFGIICRAQDQTGPIPKAQARILSKYLESFPEDTQVALAIVENEAVRFYGAVLKSDTLQYINNQKSVFEIGSLSKVFTSTLLADFVIENRLSLDDSINNYLPYNLHDSMQITFIELANHTSGLQRLPGNLNLYTVDQSNPYKEYDEEKLKVYLTKYMSLSKKQYAYSNLGAGLLGYVLSVVADSTYEQLLQSHVFEKFNMPGSTTNRDLVKDNLIYGLDANGNKTSNWDLAVLAGAGGILSNTEDLSKFAMAQFNPDNKALSLSRAKTVSVSKTMDVALGWHIIHTQNGHNWFWHNGGTGGYTTSMTVDTQHHKSVIILSNISSFHPNHANIDQLCWALMNNLL